MVLSMKYVKAPGQIYDLVRLFGYHFNKSTLDKIIDNPEDYAQTHMTVLNGEQINDDLFLFFYSEGGTINFITKKISEDANTDILADNLFEIFCQKLSETELFGDVLKYYLDDANVENANKLTPEQVYNLVKDANIPDRIKLQLVHFSMNKDYYKNLLLNEIRSKFMLVEKYFQKVKVKIEYAQRLIEAEGANSEILNLMGVTPNSGETIYCSVSSMQDKLAYVMKNEKQRCLIIGYGAIEKLQEMLGPRAFDMYMISKALSDTLRIAIVNMVKEKGEMNTTEIANAFDKGLTAVFYHLNMLAEAQILLTRSRGRTVLYRVNTELFNNFSIFIKEFAVNKDARL